MTSSYVQGTTAVSLLSLTVGQSLQAAVNNWPDREALVFLQDGVRKTFSQFQQDVDQLAAGLLAIGLMKGDRLGVWGPNTYEWTLFQFATAKAGIIMVSLNPAFQLQELEFVLKKVRCNAVVCPTQFKSQRFCEMLRQICPELNTAVSGTIKSSRLPDLCSVIVTDSRQPGMLHVDDVMQAAENRHYHQLKSLQRILSPEDPINIQFTSGTTGTPKGATLSHHNIVNNAYFVGLRMGYSWRANVRVCIPVPMYHCFGSVLGGMCMAVHGITLVFPSTSYDGLANLEAIQKEKCTVIYGTPTMYIDLLSQPNFENYDLSSLETGIMGGSSCPPEVVRKVINNINLKELTVAYGSTENSPITFLGFPLDRLELKTNSVGCILNHTEGLFSPVFRLRPYHPENARSRLISEAKQGRAWLVLGWETAWEYQGLFSSVSRLRPYHPENARSRLISEAKQGRAWLVLGWETAWEYQAMVVEPSSGQPLPLGQPGELLIRGYCVMLGYWDEPDKTRESISSDGWYKTGDTASLDGNGYCRIEGRIKDMISRGGEKIFPAEVEQFLYTHPKVTEVQVVGVKDERMGEQVCACIKVAEGEHCTEEEIKAYCKGQISYFKIPHYVMFVESYPLTASGKIQKNKLRAEMEKRLGL